MWCGNHTAITDHLGEKYTESRMGIGLLDDGRVVKIFASPTGTWTLLVTQAGGPTCLVASGEAWQGGPAVNKIGYSI